MLVIFHFNLLRPTKIWFRIIEVVGFDSHDYRIFVLLFWTILKRGFGLDVNFVWYVSICNDFSWWPPQNHWFVWKFNVLYWNGIPRVGRVGSGRQAISLLARYCLLWLFIFGIFKWRPNDRPPVCFLCGVCMCVHSTYVCLSVHSAIHSSFHPYAKRQTVCLSVRAIVLRFPMTNLLSIFNGCCCCCFWDKRSHSTAFNWLAARPGLFSFLCVEKKNAITHKQIQFHLLFLSLTYFW